MARYNFFYYYLGAFVFLMPLFILLFRRWRKPSPLRLVAGNAVVFFFLAFFTLVVGEGYFYFFYDTTDGALLLPTSKRWMARHIKKNALGYRGKMPPKAEEAREPGEMRIGVLGDSFAFGHGIAKDEDLFSEVLEKKLRDHEVNARVYNLGQLGLGTDRELTRLALLYVNKYAFDMIILAYVMNDHFSEGDYPPEVMEVLKKMVNPPPLVEAVITRSLFLSYLWHRFVSFRQPAFLEYDRMSLKLYRSPNIKKRFMQDMRRIVRFCKNNGAKLLVVTFPMMLKTWDQYALGEIHRELGEFWQAQGVQALDLLEEYQKYPPKKLIVNKLDTHPNEFAHRIAADKIYEAFFSGK